MGPNSIAFLLSIFIVSGVDDSDLVEVDFVVDHKLSDVTSAATE